MNQNLNIPILFLVFNRPDLTKKVFERIRQVKPKQLFVGADGPRKNRKGENELCENVRKIATQIDWNCEVKTLFRDENLGCGKAVSEAITWFFDNVEEGVILEDDCLPDISFFRFCKELLEKYRSDNRVMSISGSNLLGYPWKIYKQSYFWGQGGIWGWATWKRAWSVYDFSMEGWKDEAVKSQIRNALQTEEWFQFYYPMFEASYRGTLDSWDIQWLYTILINEGLSINPGVNLVKNLGFGTDSTHTGSMTSIIANLSIESISFPLEHPNHREVDIEQLNLMYKAIHSKRKTLSNNIYRYLKLFRL